MSPQLTVLLTATFAATACALVGSFLVLRRMAMMADAISHAILPGLVVAYFLANGPRLIPGVIGATAAGVATVVLVEALQRSRRVKADAAIGIVFPALFAFGTFLISRYFSSVHLDADAVLFGEIAFAPFDRLVIGGVDYGSQPMIVLGALSLINLTLVCLFYKEFKIATFDPGLAAALGFSPLIIHYSLMTAVSVTTVGAFAAVGAILVVALMIVPAATAYLLTDRLGTMIALSVAAGVASAAVGYGVARELDVSISGMMSVMAGILFALAALFSPSHGVVARSIRRRGLRERFAVDLLILHLHHHEMLGETASSLAAELDWSEAWLQQVTQRGARDGLLDASRDLVALTDRGHEIAEELEASIGRAATASPLAA